MLKSLLRRLLPTPLLTALNSCRPTHRRWLEANRRHAAALAPLRAAHHQRNTGAAADEFVLRDGLRFRIHPDSREPFEYFCFRSAEMTRELDEFIGHIGDRSALLDIGALHGIFSLAFAAHHPGSAIVAVDASPLAFTKLRFNVECNCPPFAITPLQTALSDQSGTLTMHYEWEHAVEAPPVDGSPVNAIVVPMTTGDLLCAQRNFRPDTLKIDVEGHEVKVLRGLRATLAREKPLIFLEVHPTRIAAGGDSGADVLAQLRSLGYRARNLTGTVVPLVELFNIDDRVVLLPKSPSFP